MKQQEIIDTLETYQRAAAQAIGDASEGPRVAAGEAAVRRPPGIVARW